MNKILYPVRRIWEFIKSHVKILLVFAAFFLMIASSSIIMYNTLSKKLLEHADEAMNEIQEFLSAEMTDPEIALHFFADTIQGMIERGEDISAIKAYMEECSSDEYKKKIHLDCYKSIFGYFDVFDEFYDGVDFDFPEGFAFKERPWYTNAVAGSGRIVLSKVYLDARMNILTMFYSRSMFDSNGNFLGVLAMSVPIKTFQQIITSRHFTQGSYGAVTDEELVLIIHPNEDAIGHNLAEVNPNFMQAKHLLEQDQDISMFRIRNYRGENSLLFSRKIHNNWYLNFMIPEAEYYRELYLMIVIISILGIFLASMLTMVLVRIDAAKRKSDAESRQKSNFLAIMSHEIRTPMNAIIGITESQLQEDDKTLPPGVKEAFDRIYYSGSLLLQIINDLLDLSKIEAGKLEIMPGRYEIASLINEVVHINKIRFDSKPIEFKLDVDENIPATLIGDEIRIKQILNNLLSNAFKYTWKGEVKLSITAKAAKAGMIDSDKPNVILVFSVRDTGQGISHQDLKNIFDEYTRFNIHANRSTVGTGLGLSITRNLVNLMRGEIFVESEPDKGSTFTVHLPQKTGDSSVVLGKAVVENLHNFRFSSVSQMKKTPVLRDYMPYGRILIVDDVEMNLFVAKLLMRPYGLKIDTASSGYEAIDRIKNGNIYDVIFMDHMMPKMDGIEAIKIIRGLGYAHPVIALTANAVAGQADFFLTNGFDDFISKPIDIRILNAALNKHIRDKQKEDTMPGAFDSINIPGLDFKRGLDVFEGDMDDYMSALHSFIKNVPDIIDKLRCVTEENLPEYAINVHGLKSISAWICAEGIREGAAELEALAKAGDLSAVTAKNDKFLNNTNAFLNELKTALEAES